MDALSLLLMGLTLKEAIANYAFRPGTVLLVLWRKILTAPITSPSLLRMGKTLPPYIADHAID
jgi:hypothetical protein